MAVPNPFTDIGISYYYGFSPSGFQQDNYDYQNVSMEIAIPNTPFTISGAAGFTGSEMKTEIHTQIILHLFQQAHLA